MGLRITGSRPAVERPDSVTHWTCPKEGHGGTHHMGADSRCRHCGEGLGSLVSQQAALARNVREQGGDRTVPVWKITAWAPEPDGLLIYFEDEGYPQTYGRMLVGKSALDLIRRARLGETI